MKLFYVRNKVKLLDGGIWLGINAQTAASARRKYIAEYGDSKDKLSDISVCKTEPAYSSIVTARRSGNKYYATPPTYIPPKKMYISATLLPKINNTRQLKNNRGKSVRLLFEALDNGDANAVYNNILEFSGHLVTNVNISHPPKPTYSKRLYLVKKYTKKTLPVFYERWTKYGCVDAGKPWIGVDYGSHETRMFNALMKLRRQMYKD